MRAERWAGLESVIAGGIDREGGGDGPVVILMHGFGAPGTDLVPLWRLFEVPASVRFVFPAAPNELDIMPGARAWWPIDMMEYQRRLMLGQRRAMADQTPEGMLVCREQIVALVQEVREQLSPSQVLLGGFSQGAMLATETALFGDVAIDALVLMSGTLLSEDRWVPALPKLKDTPVYQSHGQQDPMLDYSVAEELHDKLVEAGVQTTWTPFRGGHETPPPVIDSLAQFIRRICRLD